MKNTKSITFQPLPNSVPEGTQVGDDFDLVCTFCLLKDGTVHLTQMGDVKSRDDYEKESKPMYRKDYSDMAKGLQTDAVQSPGEAGG